MACVKNLPLRKTQAFVSARLQNASSEPRCRRAPSARAGRRHDGARKGPTRCGRPSHRLLLERDNVWIKIGDVKHSALSERRSEQKSSDGIGTAPSRSPGRACHCLFDANGTASYTRTCIVPPTLSSAHGNHCRPRPCATVRSRRWYDLPNYPLLAGTQFVPTSPIINNAAKPPRIQI